MYSPSAKMQLKEILVISVVSCISELVSLNSKARATVSVFFGISACMCACFINYLYLLIWILLYVSDCFVL
jgi:hypothetical protein